MLKHLDASHAQALLALTDQNRSYLKRLLPWLNLCINQRDALHFITSANNALLNNSRLTFGIFYKEKSSGMIIFRSIDLLSGKAEIAYWIGEAFQGPGLVTCAWAKLVEIGFKQLDLQEISIRCVVTNIKSQKIPTRLGFKNAEAILKKEM